MNDQASTDHARVDQTLGAMGTTPVPRPEADFVEHLAARLVDQHRAGVPRRLARVAVPLLAAAAMVIAIALVATNTGSRPATGDLADTPSGPVADPGPAADTPVATIPPGPDDHGAASPAPSPFTTSETVPPSDDTTATTAAPSPAPDPAPSDPAPDSPAPGPPPTSAESPDTAGPTTTMPAQPRMRATATRRDDGSVALSWTIDRDRGVAGWRIRRTTVDGDREATTTIASSRDASLRRHLDQSAARVASLTYVIAALDADGEVVTQAEVDVG